MHNRQWNLGLAIFFLVASLLTLFVWIPGDTESGILIEERHSTVVGDAMAPTAAMIAVLILSLGLLAASYFTKPDAVAAEPQVGMSAANFTAIATMAMILIVSLQLMVWGGPVCVSALRAIGFDLPEYRLLTSTAPYKYIGFMLGGLTMVCGLISWVEGRFSWRAAAIAFGAVVLLIAVYDLPFDSLLLPPNGSQ